jgi:hypothetical protein
MDIIQNLSLNFGKLNTNLIDNNNKKNGYLIILFLDFNNKKTRWDEVQNIYDNNCQLNFRVQSKSFKFKFKTK